uniref:Nicotinic acetylcholine receptor alpha subunit-3 n=1 Tax=Cryptocotyle lingua TaxID=66766 RepID=A0A7U0YF77_9TREM|nr:nicotinic acetylcholine receptor alpha subunit-3 [Cryptocotyle lingua]
MFTKLLGMFSLLLVFYAQDSEANDLQNSTSISNATEKLVRQHSTRTTKQYTNQKTDEQRLLEILLKGYEPASRPTYIASNSVDVRFQMTLVQINQLDEVNQVLTLNVWIEQEWNDERLHWNPADYNNLSTLRVPCDKLWLPDIVLYNSADDYTSGYMQSLAMVSHTGNVFWSPPAKLRSSCKIDITYFPFDDQSCHMKFSSWAYDGWQLNMTKRHPDVDLTNYVQNGEWNLLRVSVIRDEIVYPCCVEPYPYMNFTIYMRRRTLYYLFNIIFPCLWLTVLSLLSFWLPPDSGEKITLGITVLLAFSVFMLLIAENMPATSEFVPLIGIYLTVTMAMTSLSIVLTVGVLHIHHTNANHSTVPERIRVFLFDHIAPLLRMSTVRRYRLAQSRKRISMSKILESSKNDFEDRSSQVIRLSTTPAEHEMVFRGEHEYHPPYRSGNGRRAFDDIEPRSFSHVPNPNRRSVRSSRIESLFTTIPITHTEKQNKDIVNHPIESSTSSRDRLRPPQNTPTSRLSFSQRRAGELCSTFQNQRDEENGKLLSSACVRIEHLKRFTQREHSPLDNPLPPRDEPVNSLILELADLIFYAKKEHSRLTNCLEHVDRQQREERDALDASNEWQMIACIVDRLLFWLFLFVAISATIVILVIMPLFKPEQ